MALDECRDRRVNCGVPQSSSCVSFEGTFDDLIKKDKLPCNVNLDDVISVLSKAIIELEKKGCKP